MSRKITVKPPKPNKVLCAPANTCAQMPTRTFAFAIVSQFGPACKSQLGIIRAVSADEARGKAMRIANLTVAPGSTVFPILIQDTADIMPDDVLDAANNVPALPAPGDPYPA